MIWFILQNSTIIALLWVFCATLFVSVYSIYLRTFSHCFISFSSFFLILIINHSFLLIIHSHSFFLSYFLPSFFSFFLSFFYHISHSIHLFISFTPLLSSRVYVNQLYFLFFTYTYTCMKFNWFSLFEYIEWYWIRICVL